MPTLDTPVTTVTTVKAKRLLLVCNDRKEVSSCDFSKWKIMAGKLDWSIVGLSTDFTVWVEYEDGSRRSLATVYHGEGDHYAILEFNGPPETGRLITARDVIPTVRLYTSCMVTQHRLDAQYKHLESLGTETHEAPPVLIIRPVTREAT